MRDASLSDIDRYARDVLEGSVDILNNKPVWTLEEIAEYAPESRKLGRISLRSLAHSLQQLGAANLGQVRVDDKVLRLWAIRDCEAWSKRPRSFAAMAYLPEKEKERKRQETKARRERRKRLG